MNSPERQSLIAPESITAISKNEWLSSILKIVLPKISPENEYLTLDFFKDGIPFNEGNATLLNTYLEQAKPLTDLPASFRITNLQLCSTEVLSMVKHLEIILKKTFTCNLYFTPGSERNCFDFHSDFQLTYVCQLLGTKEWLFPIRENEEYMIHYQETPDLKEVAEKLKTKSFLLEEGNQLFVPNSFVHCVQIRGEGPSLHLTFGSQEHTQDAVMDLFLRNAFKAQGFEERAKMPVSGNDLTELVEAMKASVANASTQDFVEMFTQKMFTDDLKASKLGRFYKRKS